MSNQIETIQFNNQSLIAIEQNGNHYVAMKPICENIGLAWHAQYERIKRDEVLSQGILIIRTPSNGGEQQMVCLPIDYLNGWLFGIDIKRVKPEIRDTLIKYKKECYQALHNYWFNGKAERPTVGKITKDQQTIIKDLVQNRAKTLPKEQQAAVIIKQWSALKTHFGKSYKDITEDQFIDAVSLLARLPLEGELITNTQANQQLNTEAHDLIFLLLGYAYQIQEFHNRLRDYQLIGTINDAIGARYLYNLHMPLNNAITKAEDFLINHSNAAFLTETYQRTLKIMN